jgi:hypothetical protein
MELIGEIKGGLGNQLFQYGATKELAIALGCPMKLDYAIIANGDYIGRKLLLDRLFTDEVYLPKRAAITAGDLVITEEPGDTPETIRRRIEAGMAAGAQRALLCGNFQHEGFMPTAGPIVRARLRQISADFRTQLRSDGRDSVAVHLRRHDYAHMGICADNYVIAAINWLKRKFASNLKIYVFSDEPLYTQSLLLRHGLNDVIMVWQGDTVSDFLWLCSFKHYVLSNSTFSWWGGYVGEDNDSLVFAPKSPWILSDLTSNPTPDRWITVDAVVGGPVTSEESEKKIKEARFWHRVRAFSAAGTGRFTVDYGQLFPCLDDEFPSHGFEAHYTYHPAWAARKLKQLNVKEHHDFSGSLHFAVIASAFVDKFVYHEYRSVNLRHLNGLECQQSNLLQLDIPDASLNSVSCMHVVEHIGLGRYGDSINPDGDILATRELVRVLSHGGTLLFVVPVGLERLQFDAHRIYSYASVLNLFADLELLEFSLITDQAVQIGITLNADPSLVASQSHGCGCFLFRKP